MTRSKWILGSALVLAVSAVRINGAEAAKPQPPTTIVALAVRYNTIDGFAAVASDGRIFEFDQPSNVCGQGLFMRPAVGNLFGGPPPSPVVASNDGPGGLRVILQNGDFWRWCWPTNSGVFEGNLFTAAGAGARTPDLAPLEDARPILTGEGAPEPESPGVPK